MQVVLVEQSGAAAGKPAHVRLPMNDAALIARHWRAYAQSVLQRAVGHAAIEVVLADDDGEGAATRVKKAVPKPTKTIGRQPAVRDGLNGRRQEQLQPAAQMGRHEVECGTVAGARRPIRLPKSTRGHFSE